MSSSVADFHRLESRLRLAGQIITRTALRVGSGGSGEMDGADLPVMRDAEGYPFLPGSSVKGALRSTIEALLRGAGLPEERGLWACDPLKQEGSCGYHPPGKRSEVKLDGHCAACRLLGSHVVASHARFCDALMSLPETGDAPRVPVEVRDGVAIDRDLRTVYRGQKYDFEVVSPGTRFNLEVFVENPKPWLMGLLILGFDQINDGFTALGGFTSRGLGRVEIEWSVMTEISARALLEGEPARTLDGAQIGQKLKSFREALTARANGRP